MNIRKSLAIAAALVIPAVSFAQVPSMNPEHSFDWNQYEQSVASGAPVVATQDAHYMDAGPEAGARLVQPAYASKGGKVVHADADQHVLTSPRIRISARQLEANRVTGG
jgi:hypothetical protein